MRWSRIYKYILNICQLVGSAEAKNRIVQNEERNCVQVSVNQYDRRGLCPCACNMRAQVFEQ